jgi:hypothetical protein
MIERRKISRQEIVRSLFELVIEKVLVRDG